MERIESIYEAFKKTASSNVRTAADILIKMAREYSPNEFLESEARLYKTELSLANDERLKESIINDMVELAENIFQQHKLEGRDERHDYDILQDIWVKNRKPSQVVFSCEGVSKKYKSSDFELKDINLELRSGQITGVVGENGNGKTTLLKIVGGMLKPDRGMVSYGVLEAPTKGIEWDMVRPKIAYLSQELGRMVGSVKKSIHYSASLHNIKGEENEKAVKNIIQRLGLTKYENANWENLSGGYKLRFALARILVWKPHLMVLDEPLANLDINTQMRVLNDLKELSQSIKHPISIILSSQNIEEVEAVSNNMVVLRNGEMKFSGKIETIGSQRKENLYEFKCDLNRSMTEDKLKDLEYISLDYNGFYYFITTPLHIKEPDFLRYCSEKEIVIRYFQNIGTSTKKLLVQNTIANQHV
jgi:ABC-2 type transport system ATP-binding protein